MVMLKWTKEKIIKFIENEGYKFIKFIKYDSSHSKILIQCEKSHEPYEVKFYSFSQGRRCNKCRSEKSVIRYKFNYEYVKSYIESFGYTLMSDDYINNRTKLTFKCDKDHVYETTFDTFKSGRRCRKCSGSKKHTIEEVKEYAREFQYEVLSTNYKDNKHKLIFMCSKFHIFKMNFNHFKSGIRCPHCKESKGEVAVAMVLDDHNIKYEKWFTFKDCRNIKPLPFDFYLNDYDILIEYDGELHYKKSDFHGGENGLKKQQYRDEIKTKYCKDNNIPLIRIPYWEFDNIEEIIIQGINKMSLK